MPLANTKCRCTLYW